MGNDNKIKISKDEVRLFLQSDMLPPDNDAPEFYDLEAEYAKTRKGKSHFTVWILLACTAAVALIVYGLTAYIGRINSSVSVGIDVFEDLNLKNLLDVVSRTEASLESVTNRKIKLEQDKAAEISNAELKRDSDLLLLDSLRLSSGEKRRRTAEIQADYESAVAAVAEKYDADIATCAGQIEEYKQQLASYDKKNVELAQQQEAAINSQRQLFEMEKQQLAEEYKGTIADLSSQLVSVRVEAMEEQRNALALLNSQHAVEMSRFDPVLEDSMADELVRRFTGKAVGQGGEGTAATPDGQSAQTSATHSFSADGFALELSDAALMEQAAASLASIGSQYADFNHIAEKIQATPWKNSLAGYVRALTSMGNKIGTDTVAMAIDLLRRQEDRLAQAEREKTELLARIAELEGGGAENLSGTETASAPVGEKLAPLPPDSTSAGESQADGSAAQTAPGTQADGSIPAGGDGSSAGNAPAENAEAGAVSDGEAGESPARSPAEEEIPASVVSEK